MTDLPFDARLSGIVRDFEKRVERLLRSDRAAEVADRPVLPQSPITGCIGLFNVSRSNRVAIYSSGQLTSKEYAVAIKMLTFDMETTAECEAEEAAQAIEAGTAATENTGVAHESAVGNADAPE